jgi:hypothetical protein
MERLVIGQYPKEAYATVRPEAMGVTKPEDDNEYEEHTVASYQAETLRIEDGCCIFVSKDSPVVPKAGDRVRMYGRGFGFPVRGIAIINPLRVVRYTPPRQFAEQQWDEHVQYEKEREERMKQPTAVSDGVRSFTNDMRQISGFGGGYEIACRQMVLAGLRWLDEHPNTDPQFRGYKNIVGVVSEENADAESLSTAVLSACDGCSGAMHDAAINHVLWIKAHGWDEYVAEMNRTSNTKGTP